MITIQNLYDEQDIPVVIVNNQGDIKYTNKTFNELFVYDELTILSKNILDIIPPNLRDAHNIGFSRYVNTKESKIMNQHLELQAIKSTGEIFVATHYIISEMVDDEMLVGATIKPVGSK